MNDGNGFIFGLIEFSEKHRYTIIIATIFITLFLGYAATKIEIEPAVRNIDTVKSEVLELTRKYGGELSKTEYLLLAFELKEGFTLDKARKLYDVIKKIEALPDVHKSLNPFNIITFSRKGLQLKFMTMAPNGVVPGSEEEFEKFKKKLLSDEIAKNLVISADKTTLAAIFPVETDVDFNELLPVVRKTVSDLSDDFITYIGGQYPIDETTNRYLTTDVPKFLILAIFVILLVYYFGFRTLRAVLLPITTVSLGTLWTIGVMALLGFKLNVVSIMTPPLVLTLGSSYSIHVLNQYYREAAKSGNKIEWIAESVVHINKTIMMAAGTTIIGFFSLVFANIIQIREFGVATSIGIVFCAALSILFFPAVLSLLPSPTVEQKKRVVEGPVTRLLGRIGFNIIRMRKVILVVVVIIVGLFFVSIQHVRYQTDFTTYYRHKEKAIDDNIFIVEKFGGFVYGYITLSGPPGEKNYFLRPDILKKVAAFEDRLKANPDIAYISSFVTYLRIMNKTLTGRYEIPKNKGMILLLSRYFKALAATEGGAETIGTVIHKDFNKITIAMRIYDSNRKNYMLEDRFDRFVKIIRKDETETLGKEIKAEMWGNALSAFYLSETLAHDQVTSVLFSALFILILTAIAFRSLLIGLFALIPMGVGIMLNFIFMYLFKIPLDVVTITFSSVAIGVGVDTSIHLIIQFNRQRRGNANLPREQILSNTLQIAGRPILLTTVSLVAGLLVFVFSSFTPIMYFGILVSMVLLTTAVGALIVLPVFLSFYLS